jgi:hypothetical protein
MRLPRVTSSNSRTHLFREKVRHRWVPPRFSTAAKLHLKHPLGLLLERLRKRMEWFERELHALKAGALTD